MEIEDQLQSSKKKELEKLRRLQRLNRERVRKFRQKVYENRTVHKGKKNADRLRKKVERENKSVTSTDRERAAQRKKERIRKRKYREKKKSDSRLAKANEQNETLRHSTPVDLNNVKKNALRRQRRRILKECHFEQKTDGICNRERYP